MKFEYEALETVIGTSAAVDAAAERLRRVAVTPAFSRRIFVSDHARGTALRRYVLLELSVEG